MDYSELEGLVNPGDAEYFAGKKPLTFARLHEVNVSRCSKWHKNFPDDGKWTASDWANAAAGEMGEACNVVKKLRRIDTDTVGSKDPKLPVLLADLGEEMADIIIYLDLLRAFYRLGPRAGLVGDLSDINMSARVVGSFWANACAGAMGRVCEVVEEADWYGGTLPPLRLESVLSVVHVKLGILARFYGVDLGLATAAKFNAVSVREGFPERL